MMITIRPALANDIASLGRLGALLVALHHEFDADRFLAAGAATEAAYAAFLEQESKVPEVVLLVAEMAGSVVGYAYGRLEGPDYMTLRGEAGVIHDLVVEPASRRQGVGRCLLDALIKVLSERGAPRLVLSTAARNFAAQRLFLEAGFRNSMIEMTRELMARRNAHEVVPDIGTAI